MELGELVRYLDDYLRIAEVPDWPGALNGLQVENGGRVSRIGAAVDASEASARAAVERDCDFLLVHHGLFWDGHRPVTARRYRRLKMLITGDVSVYSAHLPLDVHPEVGNNAVLARELGIAVDGRFGRYEGEAIGVTGLLELERDVLRERLEALLGQSVRLLAGGPRELARVGVLTGGGGSMVGEAAAAGLDALITGEGAHHTYHDAMEDHINVYYGGHYATETWGVRALAAHLGERFGLSWEFLDFPTGL